MFPLAGCGSLQAPAEEVADRFFAALAGEDLPDAGPAEAFDGFGTMARVRYQRDTVFLAEFRRGWKVMAAGCTPVPGRPYDCRVEG